MSDHKGDEASNVPLSGTESQQGEPGPQALISGTEYAVGQATSVARSQPRRAATAGSAIQHGVAQRHCRGTVT